MKPKIHRTTGIILSRTNFGEADRIITFLTPDYGKVRVMAKAVRKAKSKLAGGIELFSVSDICFIAGRGEISTLTSTRLIKHYGNIVKDINRTNAAYEFIKVINKVTEEQADRGYFDLLAEALESLDQSAIGLDVVVLWFSVQLLKLSGHTPNLVQDTSGIKLSAEKAYDFDIEEMAFISPKGRKGAFIAAHIKLLRLTLGNGSPKSLCKINQVEALASEVLPLVQTIRQSQLHA